VRGPFVISPNVPTFVAPGDTFDVSVTVANNIDGSGAKAPVNLNLQTTDGLEVTQKAAPIATIPRAATRVSTGCCARRIFSATPISP